MLTPPFPSRVRQSSASPLASASASKTPFRLRSGPRGDASAYADGSGVSGGAGSVRPRWAGTDPGVQATASSLRRSPGGLYASPTSCPLQTARPSKPPPAPRSTNSNKSQTRPSSRPQYSAEFDDAAGLRAFHRPDIRLDDSAHPPRHTRAPDGRGRRKNRRVHDRCDALSDRVTISPAGDSHPEHCWLTVDLLFRHYGVPAPRLGAAEVAPTTTMLGVTRLAVPGQLVEIEESAGA